MTWVAPPTSTVVTGPFSPVTENSIEEEVCPFVAADIIVLTNPAIVELNPLAADFVSINADGTPGGGGGQQRPATGLLY